jgi:hypothetical protein
MKLYSIITAAALPALIFLAGCAGSYEHTLNFNPGEPIRIAVLPFVQVNSDGTVVEEDANLLIDKVVLLSSEQKLTPAQFMQGLVQSELSKASLDVITPVVVDSELIHSGYGREGTNPIAIDARRVLAADPKMLCSKILACDAVLYGRVTRWDRSYYGIESVATIALKLTLVSAKNNQVLYEITAEDSETRGVTKGPTGFSNLVIEPLKGLDNEIIHNLGREVADRAIAPLENRGRPEVLNSAPPAIIASGHDAHTGSIAQSGKLVVVAFGSPGQAASFSVGNVARDIPMIERAPGHYIGEFIPLGSDSFANQFVVVSLKDEFARTTSQKLKAHSVSYR